LVLHFEVEFRIASCPSHKMSPFVSPFYITGLAWLPAAGLLQNLQYCDRQAFLSAGCVHTLNFRHFWVLFQLYIFC
jgi:hypothetical protein